MEFSKNDRQTRISYIDFLKFIGLTGIIIAHVDPPSWLFMLRNFDVPFMVILSSILGEKSYQKYANSGISSARRYFVSRIKRLVIPTWILLIIYFGTSFLRGEAFRGIKYYIASFGMTRYGIGYVWIILIYLYSALLIPLFNKIRLSMKGVIAIAAAYLLYEVAYYFRIGVDNKLINTTFYYIIPYGVLTYLGCNYKRMKNKERVMAAIVSLAVFISLGIYYWHSLGTPQDVQIAKYPPRLYYLGYGVAWSFMLLLICEKCHLKIYENSIIRYISSHSMWIYLWHILVLSVYSVLKLPEIWYIKLIIVYLTSMLIVYAVNKILDLVEGNRKLGFLKYLRG